MSAVVVFAPAIIGGWPVIAAACAGAAAALGMTVAKETQEVAQQVKNEARASTSVDVEVENSEVLSEGMVTGEQMVLTKGDIRVRVYRDERGRCRVCAEGVGHSKAELEELGREVTQKMTQMFVYNRVMTEMKGRGFTVTQESLEEDDSVRIQVRRHVE